MKLATNEFKKALRQGTPQVGIWNSLCSNIAAEVLSSSGYDWALLDMEHSPNDPRTVLGQLQAYSASATTPIVRAIWNDTVLIKTLLDLGAPGLLIPMVQSPEEAAQAVAATRYPPRGVRGVSMSQRGNKFGRVKDYLDRVEEETCLIVQVETMSALEQCAEIAAVDGIDGVFFGPADLSADMGLLGQTNHPELWKQIARGAEAAASVGKAAGTLVQDAGRAVELFKQGFSFVACGSDLNLMAKAADSQLAQIREGM